MYCDGCECFIAPGDRFYEHDDGTLACEDCVPDRVRKQLSP